MFSTSYHQLFKHNWNQTYSMQLIICVHHNCCWLNHCFHADLGERPLDWNNKLLLLCSGLHDHNACIYYEHNNIMKILIFHQLNFVEGCICSYTHSEHFLLSNSGSARNWVLNKVECPQILTRALIHSFLWFKWPLTSEILAWHSLQACRSPFKSICMTKKYIMMYCVQRHLRRKGDEAMQL